MNENDEILPVTLTTAEWLELVTRYLNELLSPVSAEVFADNIKDGESLMVAVFNAIRNEAANVAILQLLAETMGHNVDPDMTDDTLVPEPVEDNTPVDEPTSKSIWVTFQKEGIHRYPAASTDPELATGGADDVSFLSYPHRHIFHFRVTIEVFHNDRDIEFIQLKRWCENLYHNGTLELNHRSCEMMADELAEKLKAKWPGRGMVISVSEDGENGSEVFYNAE